MTSANSLRLQALELLKQAHAIDGLRPFIVTHCRGSCGTTYMLWSAEEPSLDAAERALASPYEPQCGETLEISETVTLDVAVGTVASALVDKEREQRHQERKAEEGGARTRGRVFDMGPWTG